jgi:LysR family transcriptional regulator, regulator for genes of the gallate degradation pathway
MNQQPNRAGLDGTADVRFRPSLRQLRAALAVAERGSIVRAAASLHRSPPVVTRAVIELEQQMNLDLFERSRQGIRPTEAGRIALSRMELALNQLRLAEQEAAPGSHFAQKASFQQLSILIAVIEHTTQTQAAEVLRLSQPAVTRALRELENTVQSPLFLRMARGMIATDKGETIYRRSKLALAEISAIGEDVAAHLGRIRGRVVIGALPLASTLLVPRAINALLQQHDGLQVTVVDGSYVSLLTALQRGDLDLIVGAIRGSSSDLVQDPLFEDRLMVVARAGHPLAGRTGVTLNDLRQHPWVVQRAGTPVRACFERVFLHDGLDLPERPVEAGSPLTIRTLLLESNRLSLVSPHHMHHELQAGDLCVLDIDVTDDTARTIGVTRRADTAPTTAVNAFVAKLREVGDSLASVKAGRVGPIDVLAPCSAPRLPVEAFEFA